MDKKKILIALSCIGVLLLIVGVSYAYWSLTFNQTDNNIVITDCFEIEFMEGNAINLSKAYPVSDSDGMKNNPYTFTIKNICASNAKYQINLETLAPSGKKLPDQYLKANLMESNVSKITSKLESSLNTESTIEEAVSAYKLYNGILGPNETKEFSLRIWMHSDVTANDKDSMNAIYNGRISVITSYAFTTLVDTLILLPKVTEGEGLYEVTHNDTNITYTEDETAINNLKQTEYRFAGTNPNNYVNFNNELWRIIGLVNTPEGSRVKLIRNESIGKFSWDTSESSINNGFGINEWSVSKMMHLLNNGPYYNRTSGVCYNGQNNATISCDFSNTGLTTSTKEMIDQVTWNTGSNDGMTFTDDNINTNSFYSLERSNNIGKICSSGTYCNDKVIRNTIWSGKVGLMYPSDYGYATSGGTTTNRTTCLNEILSNWGNENLYECKDNDWLYKENYQWALTPFASSNGASDVFRMSSGGPVGHNSVHRDRDSYPTIYLKTDIKIESGEGTENNPYNLRA